MTTMRTVMLLLTLSLQQGRAQEPLHLLSPGTHSVAFVGAETINERVRAAASDYRQYAPVPRIALFDIAYPASIAEYRAVDGYAVVLITVLCQDSAELPLARVYVVQGGTTSPLELLTSVLSRTDRSLGPEVARVLGPFRADALYAIPVKTRVTPGRLLIDYARTRTGFVLDEFSGEVPPYLRDLPLTAPTSGAMSSALLALVRREYPGFLSP